MVLPERIPSEIVIRGAETNEISVEELTNFLRDLVFLHDRLWVMASEEWAESKIGRSFFYTRKGRPIPRGQRLRLGSVRKESPFEIGIIIGSAIVAAPVAWTYFRILRGALLLPGEIEMQDVQIERAKGEIEIKQLEKARLQSEIEERRSRLRGEAPELPAGLVSDLGEFPQSTVESFEERVHLVEQDVSRLREDEIVVTDISVRRYARVKKEEG